MTHLVVLGSLTAAVGVLMTRVGVMTGALRARATRRHCSSCGRLLTRQGCDRCGH
jgi:hypothetical protein